MPSLVSSPGVTLDAVTLCAIHDTLRAIADDLDRDLRDVFQVDGSEFEASFEIELPTTLAGPAGKALRSVDLAWRLAFAVTERDIGELDLTNTDEAYLDEIAPVEETGLLLVTVEAGSVLATIKSKGVTTGKRLIAATNILAMLASASGVTAQDIVHAERAGGTPAVVQVLDSRRESVADAIRHELPGIPPGTKVTIAGRTPDGSQFTVTLVAPAAKD
jgi:hypothetical protein